MLFQRVTFCLLGAKFSWIAVLCSSIHQKKRSYVFVPEGLRSEHVSGGIYG